VSVLQLIWFPVWNIHAETLNLHFSILILPVPSPYVAPFLLRPPPRLQLDLSCNKIGVKGAAAIGKTLLSSSHLKELNLAANRLGDQGVAALCEGVGRSNSLSRLNLSDNAIGDVGYGSFNLTSCRGLRRAVCGLR
jgi:hypothetical protein